MFEHVLPWVGLGVLVLLCLPIVPVQRLILVVSVWGLRLGAFALLAGGAYLWFSPGAMPADIARALDDFPGLLSLLPERGSPAFALCLACWIVAALVPLLAALDVARKAARVRPVRTPVAAPAPTVREAAPVEPAALPEAVEVVEAADEPTPVGVPLLRPVERRRAADAMASAGRPSSH